MHQTPKSCPIGWHSTYEDQGQPIDREVLPSEADISVVSCHGYRSPQSMLNFYNGRVLPALQSRYGNFSNLA